MRTADHCAQLVELEQAGYSPASDEAQYPKNIEAAETRLQAQKGATDSSFGSSSFGTSAAGSRRSNTEVTGLGPIYAKP